MLIRKLIRRFMEEYDGDGNDLSGANDTGEVVGNRNEDRLAFMNAINDKNDTANASDLALVNDDGSTEPFLVASDDDGVTKQELERAAEEANGTQEVETPAAPTAPRMITLKINGQDVTKTEDEWLAQASKVQAADYMLAEAARIRREAEQQAKLNTPAPSQQDAQESQEVDWEATVNAIQMGTKEEAVAALKQLKQSMQPKQTFSHEDVVKSLDERLSFKEAINNFQRDYADIVGDPFLRKIAMQRDQELMAAGDRRGYAERYAQIGNELRAERQRLAGSVQTQAAAPAVDSRIAAKADAAKRAPPRSTSGKASASANQDDGDENVSEVIANMAKARGGPQWARA